MRMGNACWGLIVSGVIWSLFADTSVGAPPSYLSGSALTSYSITTTGFTVEFWVKVRRSPGYDGRIIACYDPSQSFACGSGNEAWECLVCNCSACQKRGVYFVFHFGGVCYDIGSTSDILDSAWHHVAATYDGNLVRLYVDGSLENSLAVGPVSVDVGGGLIRLGQNFDALNGVDGQLDEVRIWNVARSHAAIVANMNSEIPVQPGLVGYWRLNGNSTEMVAGNNFTPHGDVSFYSGVLGGSADFCDQRACPCLGCSPGTGCVSPVDCNETSTDPYLLACPRGDIPFLVTLRDALGNPVSGYNNVQLDFSGCGVTEFLPKPGEYPSWPMVNAMTASDSNGNITFSVSAGGDCADCSVTIITDCGVIATVPVRSVDVDGDAWVLPADSDPAHGLCLDVNADGVVTDLDLERQARHLDHRYPSGNCDWLAQRIELNPDTNLLPSQPVQLIYHLHNSPQGGNCLIDSTVFFSGGFEVPTVWNRLTSRTPNVALMPGQSIVDTISYSVPPESRMCLRAVLHTSCCPTPLEATRCIDNAAQCPPGAVCFEFLAVGLANADQIIERPVSPFPANWQYLVDRRTNDSTYYVICTHSSTAVGTTGSVLVQYHVPDPPPNGKWNWMYFRVKQAYHNGDLCGGGGTVDCVVNVLDVICLINLVFRGSTGEIPVPQEHADMNCDGTYDVVDVVWLVGYVFRAGVPPVECTAGPAPG